MNSIQLIGRLVADPQAREASKPVARFRIAVDRVGSNEADFVPVVTFNHLAEVVAKHLSKGRLVAVAGRLNSSRWTDADGAPRSTVEVIATSVTFLDRPANARKAEVTVEDNGPVDMPEQSRGEHLTVVG
jgi:single-strand DNA-binding protein